MINEHEHETEDFVEEDNLYNFRQLMDTLVIHKELIITVPTEQVKQLKNGFVMRKSKDNKLLQRKQLIPEDEVLSFTVYPKKDDITKQLVEGQMCVRVRLGPRKSINVLDIKIPDNEI